MTRTYLFALTAMLFASRPAAAAPQDIYIQWSAAHPEVMQDWSGRAEVSTGKITFVKNDSGSMDKIHPDQSWTIVYGRGLEHNPKAKVRGKGLFLKVDALKDAVVTVKTKGGDFSFRINELTKQGVDRLGGNVKVFLGYPKGKHPRGRGKGRRRARQAPLAKVLGEFEPERISDPAKQSEWASIAMADDGALWAGFVEWNGQDRDRVVVRRKPKGGAWGAAVEIADGLWDHYWVATQTVGNAGLFVWSAQRDGNFDLYAATVSPDGKVGAVQRLTTAPYSDFQARMAKARNGDVVLVWQSLRGGNSDVYARWLRNGQWGEETRVSPSPAHDWQPQVACDANGSAWIVWDSYETGNYDVFLRRFDVRGLGPVVAMTTEPAAQFHPTVAVDARNRVWVAWDEASVNWGKDFSRASSMKGSAGLHRSRTLALRVYDGEKVLDPAAKIDAIFTGRMKQFAELPQLATDAAGTLWLVFRHWTIRRPTEMYHEYAAKLTDEGWVGPWRFKDSGGRNTMWAWPSIGPDGALCVAYAADMRSPQNLPKDQKHSLIYRTFVATLPKGAGLAKVELRPAELPEPTRGKPKPARPTLTVAGKTYTLVMGDCHRHSDIRGHSAVDASIMDTYRYAYDAAYLDYLGMGDHNEVFGGRWPDGLRDYQWWWTQKAADLFNCPPYFIAVYSYEHSLSRPAGHRNIIFLKRGAPLRMIDRKGGASAPANQPPELWKWVRKNVLTQPGQKCVIVPHTFAAGPLADWNWPNAPFDCLLEIYQGCRGSYERWNLPPREKRGPTQTKQPGHFAQDALAKGNLYGFVSFSDHASTHNSFGCVWVEQANRAGVLDAMLAKRTYAATDQILLKTTMDDRMPGETFEADAANPPSIQIRVSAPDTIRRMDVVRNGKYIWTKRPNARTFNAEFRDDDAQAGKAYYYVRVFQRDPEAPDGDPEIAWASPFFVTYR